MRMKEKGKKEKVLLTSNSLYLRTYALFLTELRGPPKENSLVKPLPVSWQGTSLPGSELPISSNY